MIDLRILISAPNSDEAHAAGLALAHKADLTDEEEAALLTWANVVAEDEEHLFLLLNPGDEW